MKYIGIIAGAALLVFVVYKTYAIATLDDGLDRKLKSGAVILDVRTPGEYETGHINGSVNIALSKLRKVAIPFDTSTVIITCCSHGLRSVKAISVLKRRGYKHVYNGGAWSDLQKIAEKKDGIR
ncbi:MAG TPA: rhodanese-like domain-containing protein [Flavipsychrobacter sp.]